MNYDVKPKSGRPFQVDVFVPSLSIALEYNGEYHYQFVPLYHGFIHSTRFSHPHHWTKFLQKFRSMMRMWKPRVYFWIHYSPDVEERDVKKKRSCVEMGITLVTVPYWWDEELFSLATTIHHLRPDLEIPSVWLKSPIPSDKPNKKRVNSCMCRLSLS